MCPVWITTSSRSPAASGSRSIAARSVPVIAPATHS